MKRNVGLSIYPYLFFAVVTLVFADIPRLIDFQGLLTDDRGRPINGRHDLTFTIYDVPTNGAPLWTETHLNVDLDRGVFSVQLGSSNQFSPVFDTSYWIGVRVDGGTELFPRLRLTSAPYAFRAAVADSLSSNALATVTSNVIALLLSTSQLPTGVIVMWSGSISNIPMGWALCNGQNGTPDLTDRFILAVSDRTNALARIGNKGPDGSGGSSLNDTLLGNNGNDLHQQTTMYAAGRSYFSGTPDRDATGTHAHQFMPRYYALAFLMKVEEVTQ